MEKFYFITHDNHDPYFNLASEEYLLKQKDGFYMYLWVNAPSVIVGVNQNAIEEVNLSYTENNSIKVVRRLTGGGAVYHDLNNVCYTVIAKRSENENLYKKFCAPVIDALKEFGIVAQFTGRNDLTVNGKKISGNAQTVYSDRVMHHGTLLFDTDTSVLANALNPSKLKIESKGIKSVKSRVVNIRECLKKDMTLSEFLNKLRSKFAENCIKYDFSEQDLLNINKLVKEKYSTYEWNIGRSPKGAIKISHKYDFGIIDFNFDVVDGKVDNMHVSGDFFSTRDIKELSSLLNGVRFKRENLLLALANVGEYINGANAVDIVDKILS